MLKAPKKMHFIWIGTKIPQKYINNIKTWIETNPDYQAYLWIDSATVPPAREYDHLSKIEAIAQAKKAGAEIIDLASPDNQFLQGAKNARWYNDEASGAYANYAAASDILRLEILLKEGGVYIDTDIQPSSTPLGDIPLKYGFAKPMDYYNDVMCAVAGSELVKEFIDALDRLYSAAYFEQDDLSANIELELHRHFRPWKNRVASTIDMSGIGPIVPVIQQKIAQLQKSEGEEAALAFSHEIFNKPLKKKFISFSDQTWIDKGPQDLQEAHIYFREEFKFRLKHSFLNSLKARLIAKGVDQDKITRVLDEVSAKILKAPEQMPIHEVIKSCAISKKKSSTTRKVVSALTDAVSQIEQELAGLSFERIEDLAAAKNEFFPQYRYRTTQDKEQLNCDLAANYSDLDACAARLNQLRN